MIESFIVIFIVCIMLFGLLQMAVVATGDQVLHHAAARAARARAVGFNDWMVTKAVRVASIPNSGQMIAPTMEDFTYHSPFGNNPTPGRAMDIALDKNPGISARAVFERNRVPGYLAAENHAQASYQMNYEEWERGSFTHSENGSLLGGDSVEIRVQQDFPLEMPLNWFLFPFTRADEEGNGRLDLRGYAIAGEHSDLYLE